MFSSPLCFGASNNGCSTVQLNDWKFYFAGKDSSLSYIHYDSTRQYQDVCRAAHVSLRGKEQ